MVGDWTNPFTATTVKSLFNAVGYFPCIFHESARVPSLHRPVPSAVTTVVPRRSLSCMRCRHTGHYGEAAMPFPNFSRRRGLWTRAL